MQLFNKPITDDELAKWTPELVVTLIKLYQDNIDSGQDKGLVTAEIVKHYGKYFYELLTKDFIRP